MSITRFSVFVTGVIGALATVNAPAQDADTDARPAMRGVRTENVAVNGDTTIGFFVDGVYQSRAQQAMTSLVDVERVEIQRGPQGTLYGRNTFGGNIAVTTQAPQLGEVSYGFDVTDGEFSRPRLDVDNFTDEQTGTRWVWGGGNALHFSFAPLRTYGLRVGYKN